MSNDQPQSVPHRQTFVVVTYGGGLEGYELSRFHRDLNRIFTALGERTYGEAAVDFAFFVYVGGSLMPQREEGVLRVRLDRMGSMWCYLGVPQEKWAPLSGRNLREYYASLFREGGERMLQRIRKTKKSFDEQAFLSDFFGALEMFVEDETPYEPSKGDLEIRDRLIRYQKARDFALSKGETPPPPLNEGAEQFIEKLKDY